MMNTRAKHNYGLAETVGEGLVISLLLGTGAGLLLILLVFLIASV